MHTFDAQSDAHLQEAFELVDSRREFQIAESQDYAPVGAGLSGVFPLTFLLQRDVFFVYSYDLENVDERCSGKVIFFGFIGEILGLENVYRQPLLCVLERSVNELLKFILHGRWRCFCF